MVVTLHVLGILANDRDLKSRFLVALADGSCFCRLAWLDFAAGEFPKSCQRHAGRTLANKECSILLYDRDRDQCLCLVHWPLPALASSLRRLAFSRISCLTFVNRSGQTNFGACDGS